MDYFYFTISFYFFLSAQVSLAVTILIYYDIEQGDQMSKSTINYLNVLASSNQEKWTEIDGTNGTIDFLTLAMDEVSDDYTRLTRFKAGADTKSFGVKSHDYPEEIYIISGKLYDQAFDCWLEAGHYASRPPGEKHGPFSCSEECIVLEISYPSQSIYHS
jgi:hypothetical protein